jgi:hypothetical protein
MTPNRLPQYLTRQEVAKVLRLSRQVNRRVAQGELKKIKLSASRSGIARSEIDKYLWQRNDNRPTTVPSYCCACCTWAAA